MRTVNRRNGILQMAGEVERDRRKWLSKVFVSK